ncbi:MAG: hypothetical protein HQ518_05650 [Rhodopirellula sp.]|nr:hypothetical protein [Rhodopirellula sp.]
MINRLAFIGIILTVATAILYVMIVRLSDTDTKPFRDPLTVADAEAPFRLSDAVLEQPLTTYLLNIQAGSFHGYTVTDSIETEPIRREIIEALAWQQNFRKSGAMCFDPGMAFRFGSDSASTDILICLECSWMYIYEDDQLTKKVGLTRQGVGAFTEIYKSLFPEQEPVENNHRSAANSGGSSEF